MKLTEKWTREKAHQISQILDEIGLCGCGYGHENFVIYNFLKKQDQGHKEPFDTEFYDKPETEFILKVLDKWGLLEHGGSVYGSSLTDNGFLLLDFFTDFGCDESSIDYPEWAITIFWASTQDNDDEYQRWKNNYNK